MIIDNSDGLLRFYDLSGNPAYVGEKTVKLPTSIFPSYITSAKGPKAAAQRLAQAQLTGKRPAKFYREILLPCLRAMGPPCRSVCIIA